MVERASNRGMLACKGPRYRNWLKELDRRVQKLPRASDFLESGYSPFWFARYPRLIPRPIPGDPRSKVVCESDYKTFSNQLSNWEEKISQQQEANRTLTDLSAKQRKQLAALLLDTIVILEMCNCEKRSAIRMHKLMKEAPTRTRMLVRRVVKVRRVLEELREYAKNLDPILGRQYVLAAESCLKAVSKLDANSAADLIKEIKPEYSTLESVGTFGMVKLYWFFRYECRLPGDEAEVRTAQLRNAFWRDWLESVNIIPEYNGSENKGCTAVRQAVARYHP
jgi:hypothetical protein